MDKLILNTSRDGYGTDQIRSTMTVGELRDFLEDYDDETPIYLGFDNRYTYGGISECKFELEESDEDSDEE